MLLLLVLSAICSYLSSFFPRTKINSKKKNSILSTYRFFVFLLVYFTSAPLLAVRAARAALDESERKRSEVKMATMTAQ